MANDGIGAAVRRKEDPRFLTGRGKYTDDINRPGQLFAVLVRSPEAHATIASVNTTAAVAAPGVVAVFTGADLAADEVGGRGRGGRPSLRVGCQQRGRHAHG